MTRCIVTGCPRPAAWQVLESALVDYCDLHINEWLRAEDRAREDDRSCSFEEWDAKEQREIDREVTV